MGEREHMQVKYRVASRREEIERVLNCLLLLVLFSSLLGIEGSEAHIAGGQTKQVGDYLISFDFKPRYPIVARETSLLFSIQGVYGTKIEEVNVTIRIFIGDKMMHEFPQHTYPAGDFALNYALPSEGIFRVVTIIATNSGDLMAEYTIASHSEFLAFMEEYAIVIGLSVASSVAVLLIYLVHKIFSQE